MRTTNTTTRATRRERVRRWWQAYRRRLSCVVCGEDRTACLDHHHHKDREGKKAEVGRLVRAGYALSTIQAEIAKCVVLCANCHRLFHGHHTQPVSVRVKR